VARPRAARAAAPTISAIATLAIARAAERSGGEAAPILAAAGLGADAPWSLEVRTNLDQHEAAWAAAMRQRSDPGFPMAVARSFQVEDYELFGFVMLASATAGEALERASRFRRTWLAAGRWEARPHGPLLRLAWHPWREAARPGLGARCSAESNVAELLQVARLLVGRPLVPTEVTFRHRAPKDTSAHAAHFGVAPRFEAAQDGLVLPAEVLGWPTVSGNTRLLAHFERECQALLRRFPADPEVTARVRQLLSEAMSGGRPSADEVARRAGMSPRTLHRRLAGEGSRFQALLDEVRAEFARRYLGQAALAPGEVSHLLGFANPSAFHRAFRRWTGGTPGAFQAGRRPGAKR
jgi:AraC-like DNA-binding protein